MQCYCLFVCLFVCDQIVYVSQVVVVVSTLKRWRRKLLLAITISAVDSRTAKQLWVKFLSTIALNENQQRALGGSGQRSSFGRVDECNLVSWLAAQETSTRWRHSLHSDTHLSWLSSLQTTSCGCISYACLCRSNRSSNRCLEFIRCQPEPKNVLSTGNKATAKREKDGLLESLKVARYLWELNEVVCGFGDEDLVSDFVCRTGKLSSCSTNRSGLRRRWQH